MKNVILPSHTDKIRLAVHYVVKNGKINIQKQLIAKSKLERMSFESTAEGRVGVDGVDRWRNRRQRKPVFRTGSEFSVSRLLWS